MCHSVNESLSPGMYAAGREYGAGVLQTSKEFRDSEPGYRPVSSARPSPGTRAP